MLLFSLHIKLKCIYNINKIQLILLTGLIFQRSLITVLNGQETV